MDRPARRAADPRFRVPRRRLRVPDRLDRRDVDRQSRADEPPDGAVKAGVTYCYTVFVTDSTGTLVKVGSTGRCPSPTCRPRRRLRCRRRPLSPSRLGRARAASTQPRGRRSPARPASLALSLVIDPPADAPVARRRAAPRVGTNFGCRSLASRPRRSSSPPSSRLPGCSSWPHWWCEIAAGPALIRGLTSAAFAARLSFAARQARLRSHRSRGVRQHSTSRRPRSGTGVVEGPAADRRARLRQLAALHRLSQLAKDRPTLNAFSRESGVMVPMRRSSKTTPTCRQDRRSLRRRPTGYDIVAHEQLAARSS